MGVILSVTILFITVTMKFGYCFNMSWWFYGFTVLVMTFSVCFDAYINHVNKKEFLNGDLIAASLQMQG